MTRISILDVGRDPEFTIGICAPYFHEPIVLRNYKKQPEQDPWKALLEKIKVLNQDLLICRKTGIVLVLKQDIDFITLCDDPMQDGSAVIINIIWTV